MNTVVGEAPTRSTASSTATCSTGRRWASRAWALLADGPAQRDGRPGSRRPGQHAGRAHGTGRPAAPRDRAETFWGRPRHRRQDWA
ncbi:hypothetical protein ACU4GD_40380 [Cupriavidus basilensis]